MTSSVESVLYNILGSAEAAAVVQVQDGGGAVITILQPLPFCFCAAGVPHCDGVGQQTLDGEAVEGH